MKPFMFFEMMIQENLVMAPKRTINRILTKTPGRWAKRQIIMDKLTAFSNANAVFQYAHWRYSEEIISLVSNGLTYEVSIQLRHEYFNSEAEMSCLRDVIMSGADIKHYKPFAADYDFITVTYRYE